jgi:hypothetical protein
MVIVDDYFLCLLLSLTFFYLREYLKYETYIIHDKRETDKLDGLPSVLICKTYELSIIKSIIDLNPKLNEIFTSIVKSVDFISSINRYKTRSSNDQKLDQDFINKLKNSSQLLFIDKCEMNLKNETINCTGLKQIILTFNGFCQLYDLNRLNLNDSMLRKNDRLVNYEDDEIKISISFSMNFKQYQQDTYDGEGVDLYINLLDLKISDIENNGFIDLNLNNGMEVYSIKYSNRIYQVYQKNIKFSSSLENHKCSNYNQNLCHFECLRNIIKKMLNCDFKLKPIKIKSNFCSFGELFFIEEIIKNYSTFRKNFKTLCKECLPNCASRSFHLKDFVIPQGDGYYYTKKKSSLNLNFYHNVFEVKYISQFEIFEFINFMAGFLSLFFGVSLLSLMEVIELLYKLLFWIKYQKCFIKIESKLKPIFSLKIFKSLELIFEKTDLHGFGNVFFSRKPALLKLSWIIVLIIDAGLLLYFTKFAIDDYLKYESKLEKANPLITHDVDLSNRTITFLVCSSLEPRQNYIATHKRLNDKTRELFGNSFNENKNLTDIIVTYKNFILEVTRQSQFRTNYENASRLYSTIFHNYKIRFEYKSFFENESINMYVTQPNYNKMCQYITPNYTIKEIDLFRVIFHFYSYLDEIFQKNLIMLNFNMLDSKSLYTNEIKELIIQTPIRQVHEFVFLKYEKQLGFPYKSECNPNLGYSRHVCQNDCFNNIISDIFGCKVIFYETKSDSSSLYCHPFMLPLIESFEKYIRNNIKSLCNVSTQ